jgi:hypothetical protein
MKTLREKIYKLLNEKNAFQRKLARKYLFKIGELLGFHIIGDHFYEPIPNLKLIRETHDDTVRPIPGMPLVLADLSAAHIRRLERYASEFIEATSKWNYVEKNDYFRGADALSLYCLVRETGISTIIEVGQGFSTRVAAAALEKNAIDNGTKNALVTIDPYNRLPEGLQSNPHLEISNIATPVQSINLDDTLSRLGPKGMLFVDSSHVYKYGSDVEFLMRNVYPVLPAGTYLHVHDVCTPCPWPKTFYTDRLWFWNEQDLLETFLAFNTAFEVHLPVYWMCRDSKPVQELMAMWRKNHGFKLEGYSLYLRRK